VSGPWFRRYYFSFKPTCWQGWLVIVLMLGVGSVCLLASDYLGSRPMLASFFGGVGVLTLVAGFAIVWWKMDWGYDRR
jgi:hypothetical protein